MALFIFTKSILEGKPIDVFNNGDMMRDFTYVEDIVEGIQTVFVIPPRELVETSSSFVKGLVGFDDWEQVVSRHVPEEVFRALSVKLASTT